MSTPPQADPPLQPRLEVEAKFYVPDLGAFHRHAVRAGAQVLAPFVLERNWRFDRPDGSLQAAGQVLRVREDSLARLTVKGPSDSPAGRREVEVIVGDARAARAILEDLGFVCVLYYEKHREVMCFESVCLMLDELPFGRFVEVEAEDEAAVRAASERLRLRWSARLQSSYAGLIGILQADPAWPDPANVFPHERAEAVDAGALLHLEPAWYQQD